MSLHLKTPDEHGIYWAKSKGQWFLVFVDTAQEIVRIFDEDLLCETGYKRELDDLPEGYFSAWYGPFACPGGDFAETTIVASEEDHERAKKEGKAIGITHFDFRHCRGDGYSGASITITGVYDREEANRRIHGEVKEEGSNDHGIAI